MNVAFIGTSTFACPALRALARMHSVCLVVTQPDRPVGRHAKVTPAPVKIVASELALPVYQPERINEEASVSRLRETGADAFAVASYGQFLRRAVFSIPRFGTINIHASLLPAYRGAAPVHWAIIRGEATTGISTFLIDEGMDTGDMLLTRCLQIGPNETAEELESRLAELGAVAILDTLAGLESGDVAATSQPKEGASRAPLLSREDGRIDWASPARMIHNLVRGTNPWPGAWTTFDGERVKIHRTKLSGIGSGHVEPGEVGPREDRRLLIGTQDELLEIVELQRDCKPRTTGEAFLNGIHGEARFAS